MKTSTRRQLIVNLIFISVLYVWGDWLQSPRILAWSAGWGIGALVWFLFVHPE